jgi:hypothetical protein
VRLSLISLITDLRIRADLAHEAVSATPPLAGRRQDALTALAHIRSEAERLLGEDLNGSPDHFYGEYRALTSLLYERERFELAFITRREVSDERATRLCAELLGDVSWADPAPLVSTFSTNYFWTVPTWRVIAMPCGEERRLLGLPDLCHELGHALFSREARRLVAEFPIELSAEIRGAVDPAAAASDPRSPERLTEVLYTWIDSWLQEFACDLIATYMVGPAFPHQHARLRAMSQPRSPHYWLGPTSSHPADEARMKVCLAALGQLGFAAEATEIEAIWTEILTAEEAQRPAEFDLYHPPAMLERLAELVIAGCRGLGLRAYDPAADPEADIPRLINEAWRRFRSEPDSYAAWEAAAVSRLWSEWGL